MVSPDPESISGILLAKQDKTLWIGCQYIAGHRAYTYIYTLRQFSITNPPTGMFLEGKKKDAVSRNAIIQLAGQR